MKTYKNASLQRKICMSLATVMAFSAFSLFTPNVYAAAETAAQPAASTAETTPADDANSFSERIHRIINDYYNGRAAAHNKSTFKQSTPEMKAAPAVGQEQAASATPASHPVSLPPIAASKPVQYQSVYNFDWQGTPIAQSLYAVSKAAHKNVVVNGKLDGKVYVSLHGVNYGQALDYLSRSFNFNWMEEDNAIIISTSDLMLQSTVIHVDYIDKNKVKEECKALGIDEKYIYANAETGTVSVTGTPYQLMQAQRRIKELDHPVSQCLILAQLIEVSHGHNVNLGMQYSLPTYTHTGTSSTSGGTTGGTTDNSFGGNFLEKLTFSASSSASKELSNGKVIARPMVMMLNGQQGNVSFGDKVPVMSTTATSTSTNITVDYKEVGTNLKVIPIINEKTGEVSMTIDAEISNISRWVTNSQTSAPQISFRHATTSAHLRSGQSFVIGGLMSVNELDNLSGIPGLMDLPILGKLFSYHSKSKSYGEVYIMITPYIVTNDIDPKEILRQAGQ